MAEVNCIEVEFKNLVFRIIFFQLDGKSEFFHFTKDGPVVRKKNIFYRLLRDGTAAFQGMPCKVVCDSRPDDADRIYGAVLVEAAVLGGDDSFFQEIGDFLLGNKLISVYPCFERFFKMKNVSELFFTVEREESFLLSSVSGERDGFDFPLSRRAW